MEANFKLIVLGLFFSNFVCFARPFDQSDYAEELDYLTKSRPTKFRDHRRFDEHRKPRQDDKGTDKIVKFQYFHCDDKQLRDRLVELKYLTLYKGEEPEVFRPRKIEGIDLLCKLTISRPSFQQAKCISILNSSLSSFNCPSSISKKRAGAII